MVKFLLVNKEKGFTLIEVLVVLGINLLIIMLIIPLAYKDLTQTKMDVFFAELKSDVDLAQSHNFQTDDFYELTFNKKSYKLIENSTSRLIKERSYPESVRVEERNFKSVIYQNNGTFKTPGRVLFKDGNKRSYEIIFPFGKGGFYIVST